MPSGALGRAGEVDHRAVAEMDAVEIAHGDRGATVGRAKPLPMLVNASCPVAGDAAPSVELAARRQNQRLALQDHGITHGALGFKGHPASARGRWR